MLKNFKIKKRINQFLNKDGSFGFEGDKNLVLHTKEELFAKCEELGYELQGVGNEWDYADEDFLNDGDLRVWSTVKTFRDICEREDEDDEVLYADDDENGKITFTLGELRALLNDYDDDTLVEVEQISRFAPNDLLRFK